MFPVGRAGQGELLSSFIFVILTYTGEPLGPTSCGSDWALALPECPKSYTGAHTGP